MRYIYLDGRPVPEGISVMPDHRVTTFIVKVRSMFGINSETIKRVIEEKHEVVEIAVMDEVCVVK